MYLMYYLNEDGNRVYTLKVINIKHIFYYKLLYIFITKVQVNFFSTFIYYKLTNESVKFLCFV